MKSIDNKGRKLFLAKIKCSIFTTFLHYRNKLWCIMINFETVFFFVETQIHATFISLSVCISFASRKFTVTTYICPYYPMSHFIKANLIWGSCWARPDFSLFCSFRNIHFPYNVVEPHPKIDFYFSILFQSLKLLGLH